MVRMLKSVAQFGLIGLYTVLVGPPIIVASFFDGGRTMTGARPRLGALDPRHLPRAASTSRASSTSPPTRP